MANFRRSDTDGNLWWQGFVINSATYDTFAGQKVFKAKIISANIAPDGSDKYAFYVRIMDNGMAHQSFLQDPCDLSTSNNNPAYNAVLRNFHSIVIVKKNIIDGTLDIGDEVRVRCRSGDNGENFDLQYLQFVEIIEKNTSTPTVGTCNDIPLSDLNWNSSNLIGPANNLALSLGPNGAPIYANSNDPGNCPWSNGAKALGAVWQSSDSRYSQWNGTTVFNGALETTGILKKDSERGAELILPAYEDWIRLATAFETKFPRQKLKGGGYRPYSIQVSVRVRRSGCDGGGFPQKCGYRTRSNGSRGSCDKAANGEFIGFAATPGTSNHGWGGAVDLDKDDWTTGGTGTKSDEFIWLNKFGLDYNFVFDVSNENWHISWVNLSSVGLPNSGGSGISWVREGTREYDEVALRYNNMTKE